MERSNLICMLVGWHSAKNPNVDAVDLKILIDNSLMESKFTPIGTELNDLDLLKELSAEAMMSVFGKGINRKTRRNVWHGSNNKRKMKK